MSAIRELKVENHSIEIDIFREVINRLPFSVFCKDYGDPDCRIENGRYVIWNTRAEIRFGTSSQRIIGKTDFDLFGTEIAQHCVREDLAVLDSQEINMSQITLQPDNEFDVEHIRTWKMAIAGDRGPRFVLGIMGNPEDFQLIESELFSNARLTAKTESRAHLLEVAKHLAHSINNPLAIIVAHSIQLSKMIESESLKEPMRRLLDANQHAAMTIANQVSSLAASLESQDIVLPKSDGAKEVASPDKRKGTVYHDLMNSLAIVMGRSNQVRRELSSPAGQSSARQKIDDVIGALERLQKQIESSKEFFK